MFLCLFKICGDETVERLLFCLFDFNILVVTADWMRQDLKSYHIHPGSVLF